MELLDSVWNDDVEELVDVTEKLTPDHYRVRVEMPYWIGGSTWQAEGTSKVYFYFKGPTCHGCGDTDDGRIIWSERGWCDPHLTWAYFVASY